LSPTYPCSMPTWENMLVAQQKLSVYIKSTLIYELIMQHFFTQSWKSVHICLFAS